jgi:hypothetical protein
LLWQQAGRFHFRFDAHHARSRHWLRVFYYRRRRATMPASKPEDQRPMNTTQNQDCQQKGKVV